MTGETQCPRCGFDNPAGMNFCGKCGAELGAPRPAADPASAALAPDPLEATGERRQITVLFADLVGSTALSERLDPEDLAEVVRSYQGLCADAVRRFDGWIAQFLGDGVLVYFGYPEAREDDAQRAVSAGLELLAAVERLNRRPDEGRGLPLAVRLGVHTGVVVVGEMGGRGRREELALGQAPNVAARLQALAEPGTLLISEATERLVHGLFRCEPVGPCELKGVSAPMGVFRVVGESGLGGRFEAAATGGLTPMVDRERELALLEAAWDEVRRGAFRAALVRGEPGIGKSRLTEQLQMRRAGEHHLWLSGRCSPYYTASAFHAVSDLLGRLLGLDQLAPGVERLDALRGLAARAGLPPARTAARWATMLALPEAGAEASPGDETADRRRQLLDSLVAWLAAEALRQPVILAIQNLHWVDPSTLDLLDALIRRRPPKLLCLLTFRPAFEPPWPPGPAVVEVELGYLERRHVEEMVSAIARGRPLHPELRRRLVEKSDGIPLFVEEVTKMILDSDLPADGSGSRGEARPLTIPATLNGSLMERIDRLGRAKRTAQLASVLGRDFERRLVDAVSPLPPGELAEDLASLVAAELLLQRGSGPEGVYVFKHSLIQDVAYDSLLRGRRQDYHRSVARALETLYPERTANHPELLAHHYTEAARPADAVPLWRAAGRKALESSSHVEAVRHVARGLELVPLLPPGRERSRLELELQTTLGPALMATRGFSAPELARAYDRAYELCRELGDDSDLFPVLWGLLRFYSARADYRSAGELGERMVRLAQASGVSEQLLEAHRMLGGVLLHVGRLREAREHLEAGLATYRSRTLGPGSSLYLQPQVFCLFYYAQALCYLGFPDRARAQIREALDEAERLAHPFSRIVALVGKAVVHTLRREPAATLERAVEARSAADRHGVGQWSHMAAIFAAWARGLAGDEDSGAELERHVEELRVQGLVSARPLYLALLAELHQRAGHPADGLARLDQAEVFVQRTGERFYLAEVHRLRGELLLAVGEVAGAEAAFARGLRVAREQGARLLEVRTLTSWARLRAAGGRAAPAAAELSALYLGFTEGFETPDLRAARALLTELWGEDGGRPGERGAGRRGAPGSR